MNLVIVESPTKAQTIKKFLGKEYKALSSYGHIRDLPKRELGVDVEKNFEPKYVIPPKARKRVKELKDEVKKSEKIILATDEDREGEAIAWHLSQVLDLDGDSYERIVFHEITKQAIIEALKNPRKIDADLVDAQQARRILDRLVGYKLSPFLWKKVARGLSAGRVQSVAVRLVAEREKEIENFVPEEYWSIEALLQKAQSLKLKTEFKALLIKRNEKVIPKLGIKTQKGAEKILEDLKEAGYGVKKIDKKETKKHPLPPLTTSTLQQESWKKLRYPAKFTMSLAQNLYEKGFITYHRTDSLNLSGFSVSAVKKFINDNYGKNYLPGFVRKYKSKGRAQEAHEAIRPTYPDNTPSKLKSQLDERQFKLYDLIWRRFIACQMASAVFDSTAVDVETRKEKGGNSYTFRTTGQIMKFDGFLKVYPVKLQETELPLLEKEERLDLVKLIPSQHFTKPPARYTEATLIKTLEQEGIGRPSTYAPILSNIQERNYIEKDRKRYFLPTEIGILVTDLLVHHFPETVDIKFTAKMEDNLDRIASGKTEWHKVCKEFYTPFEKNLRQKYKEVSKKDITETPTEKRCPKCGSPLVIRLGRFGKFYACSSFPKCKYTEPLEKKTLGIKCPKCKRGEIVEKKTRSNKVFYGCNRFPECDFALWDKPIQNDHGEPEKCPKCGSLMVEKYGRINPVRDRGISETTPKKQISNGVKCSNKDCGYQRR